MDELEVITEVLRRRRQEIEDSQDATLSRRTETADLLGKIEDLRVRSADTLRRFQDSVEAAEQMNRPK